MGARRGVPRGPTRGEMGASATSGNGPAGLRPRRETTPRSRDTGWNPCRNGCGIRHAPQLTSALRGASLSRPFVTHRRPSLSSATAPTSSRWSRESVPSLKRRGRSFVGPCPFHKEKSPSFHVNPERGFFHCFGCKEAGSVIDFVMKEQGCTFPEAVRAPRRAERHRHRGGRPRA